MYFYVFLGVFRHVAQKQISQQKSLETLTHQGFQGFSVGALQGIRFAGARCAFGRSRSQRSTGALLCPARPSNPKFSKKSRNPLIHKGFRLGALQGIRTPDLLVRSQTLYPAELAAQIGLKAFAFSPPKYNSTESKKSQHVFVIFLSPVHIGK